MGSCFSSESPETSKRDRQVDQQLKNNDGIDQIIKLLLLGAGESGKSTVFKQLKILHSSDFSESERETYKRSIFSNVIHYLELSINYCEDQNIPLEEESDLINKIKIICQLKDFIESISINEVNQIKKYLALDKIKKIEEKIRFFHPNTSINKFIHDIDRILAPNYIPTKDDIIYTRIKTTGIIEQTFVLKGTTFKLFDVGGQRSERKKWIHCFEDVTAVVFVSALSEYDQSLVEDDKTNRMQESLKLFDSICNNRWFQSVSMLIFLNKRDLFAEKIKKIPLTVCFPEYHGSNNYDEAAKYISDKFSSLNKRLKKEIYIHLTCATDTDNIQFVFDAISDIIIRENLRECGLL